MAGLPRSRRLMWAAAALATAIGISAAAEGNSAPSPTGPLEIGDAAELPGPTGAAQVVGDLLSPPADPAVPGVYSPGS